LRTCQKAIAVRTRKRTGCNASKGFDDLGDRDHHAAEVRAATTLPFSYDTRRVCCQPRGDTDQMIASGSDRPYELFTSSHAKLRLKTAITLCKQAHNTIRFETFCLLNHFTERSAQ